RAGAWQPRPVEIVDAGARKALEIVVELPAADPPRPDPPGPPGADAPPARSAWAAIHPRLIELVRAHRSTLIFVNNRRLAERLAAAINEGAGEELALAHHGSLARERRQLVEARLKRGELRALVATSSLELGIDMGAIDLVVQLEAPPSVISGLQRVGRAGHSVGDLSRGVVIPKHRGDLLACAATAARMRAGAVEQTTVPANPLDVLAQQVVAATAMERWRADDLYALTRRAAPFATLPRSTFDDLLELLSGRYPSDELAHLRPRVTWDRARGLLTARQGARQVAVANGGTIPDRGLYGVFLAGVEGRPTRVGELDEEMVFESRVGDVFVLGASSWRIDAITHDRVLVSPAPGRDGKLPFWHGDGPGRAAELGAAIGAFARAVAARAGDPAAAARWLVERHGLDARAATDLVSFVAEEPAATDAVPSDRTIVVERFFDEVGDLRVCVLSPFGMRVHAPWAMVVQAALAAGHAGAVDVVTADDGMVFRLPEAAAPPPLERFFPEADAIERLVTDALGATALFAARFRDNAARALLLPRRRPGSRTPLWAQRRRAADLLAVAARYPEFPIVLETYRECLRDAFDLPALAALLRGVEERAIRPVVVDVTTPSPFATSLLFSFVASFVYEGDAPLAERRAQVLAIDPARLRELLGAAALRDLLEPEVIAEVERRLQRLEAPCLRHADALHDLLLELGALAPAELAARAADPAAVPGWIAELLAAGRAVPLTIAGEARLAAVEDAARYRDALGARLPPGIPASLLGPVADPLGDLVSRFARTHGPFAAERVADRLGLGVAAVRPALERLRAAGRLVEGEFLPGGRGIELCDATVLRTLKQRTLARLRRDVEPVEPEVFARFLVEWQGVEQPRVGAEALLDAVAALEGAPLPLSALLSEILPARVRGFDPAALDLACARGEILWRGVEPVGPHDGRVALFLAERYPLLAPAPGPVDAPLAREVARHLADHGALFFADLLALTGAFGPDLVGALHELVWAGVATNDTLQPLRSRLARTPPSHPRHRPPRRPGPPGSEGRWSLLPAIGARSDTEHRAALAELLLDRHGVVTREAVHAELVTGGFAAVYEVFAALEAAGRVRRGYFVAGLGAAQFSRPGAAERLRALRSVPLGHGAVATGEPWLVKLAATDPANPWGAALPWPGADPRPQRAGGALVWLHEGRLVGYLAKTERALMTWLPDGEPRRSEVGRALGRALAGLADGARRRAVLLTSIDGKACSESPLAEHLVAAGFTAASQGFLRRARPRE
ncbi:MAG TPA: helicase-related protein, partial [Polyangiaceae bacterium]|nr:helicase-related protein [Polyangiaceae bacterium]